jgi:hypothetical protein
MDDGLEFQYASDDENEDVDEEVVVKNKRGKGKAWRKSGRPAKAKRKYVIQDYAMNVADPEEGDGYDMDDDANDYDDDARGHLRW